MNEEIWNQLKEAGQIPAYLNDITLEFQEDRQLRGYIPNDTHLLERSDAEGDAWEYLAAPDSHPVPLLNEIEDETVLEALKDIFMETLRNMHTNQELTNKNLSLNTIEKRMISDSAETEPVQPVLCQVWIHKISCRKVPAGEFVLTFRLFDVIV